jgi:hypothetical protein
MCKDLKKYNVVNSSSSSTPFPHDVNYGALNVVDQIWFSTLVCDKLGAPTNTLSFCLPMLLDKLSSTTSKFSSTTNKLPKNYGINSKFVDFHFDFRLPNFDKNLHPMPIMHSYSFQNAQMLFSKCKMQPLQHSSLNKHVTKHKLIPFFVLFVVLPKFQCYTIWKAQRFTLQIANFKSHYKMKAFCCQTHLEHTT